LPNELILLVLDNLSDSALSVVRTVSRRWANLANVILVARFEAKIEPLAIAAIDAKRTLIESEVGQRHGLAHYKDFLRRIPPSDLSEAIWFASPPEEVRTICECLLRLKGISNDSSSGSRKSSSTQSAGPQPMPWKVIKKHMSQYDFKRWFLDLQVNVDFIPHRNIKFVEEIIMMAPDTINYDHVRSVSLAGYRLLILVAACLQYGCISEDLRTKKNRVLKIEKTLVNVQKFIDAI
ncbi:uncharacterized protein EV422DRAFT_485002, partial [Fimicolochytrium jonesii]|uniref:uncharacterized protein n=1 Tax=Fimicolochytrium jonesii TaxID=1396493 RepID=UPI0022FE9CFA